jgi:hypothetical protein
MALLVFNIVAVGRLLPPGAPAGGVLQSGLKKTNNHWYFIYAPCNFEISKIARGLCCLVCGCGHLHFAHCVFFGTKGDDCYRVFYLFCINIGARVIIYGFENWRELYTAYSIFA